MSPPHPQPERRAESRPPPHPAPIGAALFTRSNDGLRPTERALALVPQSEAMAAADPSLVPVLPDFVLARVCIWMAMHEDRR